MPADSMSHPLHSSTGNLKKMSSTDSAAKSCEAKDELTVDVGGEADDNAF